MLTNLKNLMEQREQNRAHNRFIAEDAGVVVGDTNPDEELDEDLDSDTDTDEDIDPELMNQIDTELDTLISNTGQSSSTATEDHITDVANRLLNDDDVVTESAVFNQLGTGFEFLNYHIPKGPKDVSPGIDIVNQKDIEHSNQVGNKGYNEPARMSEDPKPIKQDSTSVPNMIDELYNK